jgi:hypothetical protein
VSEAARLVDEHVYAVASVFYQSKKHQIGQSTPPDHTISVRSG